jgi:hypothetical protein
LYQNTKRLSSENQTSRDEDLSAPRAELGFGRQEDYFSSAGGGAVELRTTSLVETMN